MMLHKSYNIVSGCTDEFHIHELVRHEYEGG
jgi:hypothetical protein